MKLEFSWTNFLIIVNVIIFFLAILLLGDLQTKQDFLDSIEVFGAFEKRFVENGGVWVMVTSTFLHFDIFHFFFNFVALVQLARFSDVFYGSKKTFAIYILSGLLGNILSFIVMDYGVVSIGASGAVFGILGLLFGGTLKRNRYGADLPFAKESFYPTLAISIFLPFVITQINWAAHLGGFIAGLIAGLVLNNSYSVSNSSNDELVENGIFYLSLSIFVISYILLVSNIIFDIV